MLQLQCCCSNTKSFEKVMDDGRFVAPKYALTRRPPWIIQVNPYKYYWELAWLFDTEGAPRLLEDLIKTAYAETAPTSLDLSAAGRAKYPENLAKAMTSLNNQLLEALKFAEKWASPFNSLALCVTHIKSLLDATAPKEAKFDTERSKEVD